MRWKPLIGWLLLPQNNRMTGWVIHSTGRTLTVLMWKQVHVQPYNQVKIIRFGVFFLHLLRISEVDKILFCPVTITAGLRFILDNNVWYMSPLKSAAAVFSCHPPLKETGVVLLRVQFCPVESGLLFLNAVQSGWIQFD